MCIKIRGKLVKYLFFPTIFFMMNHFILSIKFYKSTSRSIPQMKYVLQWTDPESAPFKLMGTGQNIFLNLNCPVNNCYITSDETYLDKVTDYDAILFNSVNLRDGYTIFPAHRSSHQKYVFLSAEASNYYPLFNKEFDSFFNWTWTFKLDSDFWYGYISIKNKAGETVGPKKEMHWLKQEDMGVVDSVLRNQLLYKRKAAAWFVSNCHTPNRREDYVQLLKVELEKYNMTVDIYGSCGSNNCSRDAQILCENLIQKFYYFYLAFENSFDEDYVTEKLLIALNNNAVPIVFGGANYSRFMPHSAYLDARKLGVKNLVRKMVEAIHDTKKYYEFFTWKNNYTYVGNKSEIQEFCKFCQKLNENDTESSVTARNFIEWWNYFEVNKVT